MKKYIFKNIQKIIAIISIIGIISVGSNYAFAEDINISARVWVANQNPEIISITPNFSPVVLAWNTLQSFSLQIKDNEWDQISYTITPDFWWVNPISGTISNSTKIQNGEAYINFNYVASWDPAANWASKITITLNDGVNPIIVEEIDIYTY